MTGADHKAAVGPSFAKLRLRADHVDLLNQYRLQHIIGVQFQHTAPEWRLEDVVYMLAVSHFTGLGN